MARADREVRGRTGAALGDRQRTQHVGGQAEAGAEHGERRTEVPRARRGQQRERDETRADQRHSADEEAHGRCRAPEPPRYERRHRERAHDERACERLVAPHFDDEEDAEEQRADRRGAHEREREVGPHGAPLDAPREVSRRIHQTPLARASREHSHESDGRDRRLQVEDRPPVEDLREQTTHGRADHRADHTGTRPESPPGCGRSLQGGQHGERGAEHQRGSGTLKAPGDHQARGLVARSCRERRTNAKRASPKTTSNLGFARRATRREQQGAHTDDERVGRDDPRHADDRGVELAVDLGEGEDDDRGVGERERDRDDEGDRADRPLARPRPGVGGRAHRRPMREGAEAARRGPRNRRDRGLPSPPRLPAAPPAPQSGQAIRRASRT